MCIICVTPFSTRCVAFPSSILAALQLPLCM